MLQPHVHQDNKPSPGSLIEPYKKEQKICCTNKSFHSKIHSYNMKHKQPIRIYSQTEFKKNKLSI